MHALHGRHNVHFEIQFYGRKKKILFGQPQVVYRSGRVCITRSFIIFDDADRQDQQNVKCT